MFYILRLKLYSIEMVKIRIHDKQLRVQKEKILTDFNTLSCKTSVNHEILLSE
jgi:hypothetical protein